MKGQEDGVGKGGLVRVDKGMIVDETGVVCWDR